MSDPRERLIEALRELLTLKQQHKELEARSLDNFAAIRRLEEEVLPRLLKDLA